MCLGCGDADKKKALEGCDGVLKPYMTLAQLIDDLFFESAKTGQRIFNIFKGCLVNPPESNIYNANNLTINFL